MEILQFLEQLQQTTDVFTINDVIFTITLNFVLSLLIAWVYRATHTGISYNQSYVHTMIIVSLVVAVIMLIIGSNIARAFTLVGALSIVRFRNAVKDTRDVGFIFYAMAIGMACGTRFYMVATVATLLISALIWGMFNLNLFAKDIREQVLKIRLPSDMPYQTLFDQTFLTHLTRADLIAIETVQAGTLTELIYSVELKKPDESQAFIQSLRQLNQNNKVVLVTGLHEVDL
ncbi:DUF4956 domain-containing protein [Anaerolineales bacterium HSG6]|nr:DUF4956 domain-containing protein [Anaerolineales bacterium HSG6]MDM8532543.1 DUF4956 domain-containing protein [Anaerolineales bacterium HSG25]